MKAKARVIRSSIKAAAHATRSLFAFAKSMPASVYAQASATDIIATKRYLEVTPTEPQTVMWVVPGNEIEYIISSNTDWWVE